MGDLADVAASVLVIGGASLVLLAGVNLNRFDDVFARMHAATKAATLGLLLAVGAAIIEVDSAAGRTKLVLVVGLQLLTAPIAAHMVGRAAYKANGPSPTTMVDELADADRGPDEPGPVA
jgi:multicomponent Na+:H+ antiporter subunit G